MMDQETLKRAITLLTIFRNRRPWKHEDAWQERCEFCGSTAIKGLPDKLRRHDDDCLWQMVDDLLAEYDRNHKQALTVEQTAQVLGADNVTKIEKPRLDPVSFVLAATGLTKAPEPKVNTEANLKD